LWLTVENFENYTRQWGAHVERVEDNRLGEKVIQYRLRGEKEMLEDLKEGGRIRNNTRNGP
jgi:hypothetical protein